MTNNGELIRALVRPIISIFLVVSWVIFLFCTFAGGGDINDVPLQFTAMTWTAFIWWFGSREIVKRKEG